MPNGMSLTEYTKPPDYWVGRSCGAGKIMEFADGVYTVTKKRNTSTMYHWELMNKITSVENR